MGEVWRARDTRLDREVAIKVLPDELADDEERLKRFEREAKTLASLNHPNGAGSHGVEQEGEVCFLAWELVPGEDVATRSEKGGCGRKAQAEPQGQQHEERQTHAQHGARPKGPEPGDRGGP